MNTNAITKIGYGLYILTSSHDGRDNGCIINSVSQVALSPDKIMISVNNNSLTCEMIKKSRIFNLSVLKEETPFYVFEHFGFYSGRDKNKFEKTDSLFRSENNIYVVPKYANAYMSCKVTHELDLGTHTLFIAELTGEYVFSDEPTITYDYYHKHTKPQPQNTEKKGYRCDICGYIYEGEDIPEDFVCPICKHGISDFSKIE